MLFSILFFLLLCGRFLFLSAGAVFSAFSMVAAPHCGAGFLSNDLTDDEIPSAGGHHRFALTPVYTQHRWGLAGIFELNKIVTFAFPGLVP